MNKSKHVFESLLVLLIVILSIPAVSESNNIIPQASSLSLATISLDPTSGPVGTTVTVTGSLFLPLSVVTISYDGTAVATTPGTITTDLSGGFSATFTVPASTAGSHTVSAKNAASNSASAQFTVTATIPSAPTNLSATAVSPSQINLSWTAPTNNGGSAITGYKIERSTDGGTTWSIIVSSTGSTATIYSDTGLASSTTYTYRVSAINVIGTSSPSSTASTTTVYDGSIGMVTLAFGHAFASELPAIKNVTNYQFVGNISPVETKIGTVGYMTQTDLLNYKNTGWQILSHSMTHPRIDSTTSSTVLQYELVQSKDFLTNMG